MWLGDIRMSKSFVFYFCILLSIGVKIVSTHAFFWLNLSTTKNLNAEKQIEHSTELSGKINVTGDLSFCTLINTTRLFWNVLCSFTQSISSKCQTKQDFLLGWVQLIHIDFSFNSSLKLHMWYAIITAYTCMNSCRDFLFRNVTGSYLVFSYKAYLTVVMKLSMIINKAIAKFIDIFLIMPNSRYAKCKIIPLRLSDASVN